MTHRIERVNSLIRQEISELLQREVKDPRLGNLVAITDVSTSLDLRYAKVFVSRIGSEEEKQETINVLAAASGFFRNELSKRLQAGASRFFQAIAAMTVEDVLRTRASETSPQAHRARLFRLAAPSWNLECFRKAYWRLGGKLFSFRC